MRRDTWVPPYRDFFRAKARVPCRRIQCIPSGGVRSTEAWLEVRRVTTGNRAGRPYGVRGMGCGAIGLRIATASVRTGFAMTEFARDVMERPTARVAPTECDKNCGAECYALRTAAKKSPLL